MPAQNIFKLSTPVFLKVYEILSNYIIQYWLFIMSSIGSPLEVPMGFGISGRILRELYFFFSSPCILGVSLGSLICSVRRAEKKKVGGERAH